MTLEPVTSYMYICILIVFLPVVINEVRAMTSIMSGPNGYCYHTKWGALTTDWFDRREDPFSKELE